MKDRNRSIGMTSIFGLLFGVVISSMTEQWWWIGVGFALGLALEALQRRYGARP